MAEAQLIPGATQVFADVLEGTGAAGSGNVQKLFANMQKGKYTLQDIVKVLDSLEGRIKQDLLDKALSRPAALMAEMQTAYQRLLAAFNDSGALELMVGALKSLTDILIQIKQWARENKDELKTFFHEIKVGMKILVAFAPELLAMWGIWKAGTLAVKGYQAALKWALAAQAAFLAESAFVGAIKPAATFAEKLGLIVSASKRAIIALAGVAFTATVLATIIFMVWSIYDLFAGNENVFSLLVEKIDELSKITDGGIIGFLADVAAQLKDILTLVTQLAFSKLDVVMSILKGDWAGAKRALLAGDASQTDFTKRANERWGGEDNVQIGKTLASILNPFDTAGTIGSYPTPSKNMAKTTNTTFSPTINITQPNATPEQINTTVYGAFQEWMGASSIEAAHANYVTSKP